MAPPKKFTEPIHRYNCQFPESLFQQLKREADQQGIKINDLLIKKLTSQK